MQSSLKTSDLFTSSPSSFFRPCCGLCPLWHGPRSWFYTGGRRRHRVAFYCNSYFSPCLVGTFVSLPVNLSRFPSETARILIFHSRHIPVCLALQSIKIAAFLVAWWRVMRLRQPSSGFCPLAAPSCGVPCAGRYLSRKRWCKPLPPWKTRGSGTAPPGAGTLAGTGCLSKS